jgi:hypothetical protein
MVHPYESRDITINPVKNTTANTGLRKKLDNKTSASRGEGK